MLHTSVSRSPDIKTSFLVPDLDEGLRLVGLQTLTFRQQPHVKVWLVVACRSRSFLPLHAPRRCVVAAKEVSVLLHIANVVLVQGRRVAVDQIQKAGVIWVGRNRKRRPGDVCRSAGGGQCCVGTDVEAG